MTQDRRHTTRRRLIYREGGRRADDPPASAITPGFPCPACAHPRTRVSDSLPRPNRRGYRRRRVCVACGEKFWTFEAIDVAS